jgi:hypothetical protein
VDGELVAGNREPEAHPSDPMREERGPLGHLVGLHSVFGAGPPVRTSGGARSSGG